MEPFFQAVSNRLFNPDLQALLGERGWLTTLAWLTRDQECRFDHPLDWRAPESDSDSPVRNLGRMAVLQAMRALIGALDPEEVALVETIERAEEAFNQADRDRTLRTWAVQQRRDALKLGKDEGVQLSFPPAEEHRESPPDEDFETALRQAHDEVLQTDREFTQTKATLDTRREELRWLQGELTVGLNRAAVGAQPVCMICEVPIDRALAEGCRLSHKLPDLERVRAEREAVESRVEQARRDIRALEQTLLEAEAQRDAAAQRLKALRAKQDEAKAGRTKANEEAQIRGRRQHQEAELVEATRLRDLAQARAAECFATLERHRVRLKDLRDAQALHLDRFNHHFGALVHHLVGSGASGRISVDGNGLHTKVTLGGDRTTAAIESLKVIAFDLAALLLAVEGRAHLPAFLVHDSPREADLGLSIYHPIFTLMRKLEALGTAPAFQYIITTTTQPPPELQKLPWLRLELHGAPKEERLLRRDL